MEATNTFAQRRLPLLDASVLPEPVIEQLHEHEARERERLGLLPKTLWRETGTQAKFLRSERPNVTLLLGGLTKSHDRLIEGAFRGLGYGVRALDCPTYDALRVGKEFGNRGQCNPTYFTVGNLVSELQRLITEEGLTKQQVVRDYVFLTAGACGPCRFGMYVTEYRKALRDAGFDGFRVLLFQQQGGLKQATGDEEGLQMNPKFFVALLKALLAGDAINALAYRIRPYEVVPGSTNQAMEKAKAHCYDALLNGHSVFLALHRSRKYFAGVEIDPLRVVPKVSIIGEFWAMTTEGDGNYHLQEFIEQEGGEVDIQIVTNWLLYNIWEVRFDTQQRAALRGTDGTNRGLKNLGEAGVFRRNMTLLAGDRALRVAFFAYARALGLRGYPLADMDKIAEIAAPYYNNDIRGGEGHMEVGKVILNAVSKKSTLTVSVKPFGCMPSSGVSDGVQSLIVEKFPGTLFCAVETSGDGAVNFQSRVQMYLSKARQSAREELQRTLEQHNLTLDGMREYLTRHPTLGSPLFVAPHRARTKIADLVHATAQRQVPVHERLSHWARTGTHNFTQLMAKLTAKAAGHSKLVTMNPHMKASDASRMPAVSTPDVRKAGKSTGARIAA
jgi:predicted nucleotide-binding protein (sugar kinase/HSP70/actin superfamily)